MTGLVGVLCFANGLWMVTLSNAYRIDMQQKNNHKLASDHGDDSTTIEAPATETEVQATKIEVNQQHSLLEGRETRNEEDWWLVADSIGCTKFSNKGVDPASLSGAAKARALYVRGQEFNNVPKSDQGSQCLWEHPTKVVTADCRDKKHTVDAVGAPFDALPDHTLFGCSRYVTNSWWKYKTGETPCGQARKGWAGRRRAWHDAFHNCASTCGVCGNPTKVQATECYTKATSIFSNFTRTHKPNSTQRDSRRRMFTQNSLWSAAKVVTGTKPSTTSVTDLLKPVLIDALKICGKTRAEQNIQKCQPWCEDACGGSVHCCNGGLMDNECTACDFCLDYDLGHLAENYFVEQHQGSLLETKQKSNEPLQAKPGFIISVGASFGLLFGDVSASFGVLLGKGQPQFFVAYGWGVHDSLADLGFSLAVQYAPYDVTCALGKGYDFALQGEPIDALPGIGQVTNLAVGPVFSFACAGSLLKFWDCRTFCSYGVQFDGGGEVDVVPIVDFSVDAGLVCPIGGAQKPNDHCPR